jgi:hypothetical protein
VNSVRASSKQEACPQRKLGDPGGCLAFRWIRHIVALADSVGEDGANFVDDGSVHDASRYSNHRGLLSVLVSKLPRSYHLLCQSSRLLLK